MMFSSNVWRRVPQLNHNKPLAGTLGLSFKETWKVFVDRNSQVIWLKLKQTHCMRMLMHQSCQKKRKTKKVFDSFLRDIGMPEVPIALWASPGVIFPNRPFYRCGGHIELIGFKKYYGMPRGDWARSDILATVFLRAFWANFSLSFPRKRL